MDFERYLAAAREQGQWLAGTIDTAIGGYVMGGWQGVGLFALAMLLMFLLTSLLSPRR